MAKTSIAGSNMTSTKFSLRFFRDKRVNGRADLPDFFPVWLDLSEALALLDAVPGGGRIEIKLRHTGDALAYVPTALSTNDAGAFLVSDVAGLASAATRKITAAGVALPGTFIDAVRADPSKGVILIEGRAATTEPLVLEIWRKGRKVLEKSLPLHVAPVEQMYARVNLRDGAAAVTPGSCLPPANGTNVVFLHGYNVNAEEARARHAEMFKRLWQSGSKARFHGVTWEGDIGWPNALRYHEDVVSAFATAPHLKNYVNGLSGEKIMMAHSLGNMVVSSAIADHGMSVGKYFMLNAAVPAEAYDPSLWSDSPDASNRLVHDYWRDYTNTCWSAKWHELFAGAPSDDRGRLTWKGRFAGVLTGTAAYNFYSSGDSANSADGDQLFELLEETPATGTPPPFRRYAWQKQETHKGRNEFDPAGTSWAGWGFAKHEEQVSADPPTYTMVRDYSVAAANATAATNPLAFAEAPVFRKNPPGMFTNSIPAALRNELLAKGIPALSPAAGKTEMDSLGDNNFNMNTDFRPEGGAWGRNHEDYETRWLHSDMKDMAYFYTHRLFDKLVEMIEEGNPQ